MDERTGQKNTGVAKIVHKNTRTMLALRKQAEKEIGIQEKLASWIARNAGSMRFVYLQTLIIILWVLLNRTGIGELKTFDPYPFPLLSLLTTFEAIFLAIFILIKQNRIGDLQKTREELDLQINLLTEHEVSRLIRLVDAMAKHMNVEVSDELHELKVDTSPEQVLNVIEKEMEKLDES